MSTVRYLLVIRADQSVRIGKRPRIYADEIAIPIWLTFPDQWGRVLTDSPVEVTVPDFAPEVRYEQTGEKQP
jgi:hypothetical protein